MARPIRRRPTRTCTRTLAPALLAVCLCIAACRAASLAEGGGAPRRNLLFVADVAEEDDDEETFSFSLEKTNLTLRSNSTEKFCFTHEVSCVRYDVTARDAETGEPASILTFVSHATAAEQAQEERVMSTIAMLGSTYCRERVRCLVSAEVDDTDDLCLVLVNADLRFNPSDPNLDFTAVEQGDVLVDIRIEGCRTTSQKIVAIAIPIAVFVGVAACFSTWWIRRRRKETTSGASHPHPAPPPPPPGLPTSGSNPVAGMATQQMDVGGLAPSMPVVTPTNPMGLAQQGGPQVGYMAQVAYGPHQGYGPPQGGYGPQGTYAPQGGPLAYGTANPSYVGAATRQVSSKGYPMVVANV